MFGRCLVVVCLLAGCASSPLPPHMSARLEGAHHRGPAQAHLKEGLEHLVEGDLKAANDAFNQGLLTEPQDPHLNFFNAFTYHARAEAGEVSQAPLAEVGYRLALKFDPGHWLAAWHLGRFYWSQQRMDEARARFAQALMARPQHAPSAYGLAATSYALGDPHTAASVLDQLPEADQKRPSVVRANAMVQASMGDTEEARSWLTRYQKTAPTWAANQLSNRVDQWASLYAMAQHQGPDDAPGGFSGGPEEPEPGPEEKPARPGMVVIDVVLITQETSATSRRGINLMSALKAQFGGTLVQASRSASRDATTGAITSYSESSNSDLTISVPTVEYSLNIANAQDSHNEILARPSVLAHDQEESELFIGSELTYVAPGNLGGQSYNKEVGITLTTRPEFLETDRLRLRVSVQFSSFLPIAAPGSFEQAVSTLKNRSSVTADMKVGQTLAVAAGSTSRENTVRDGVPILRDIPIIQYLFSSSSKSRSRGTLLILLTPRWPAQANAEGDPRHLSSLIEQGRGQMEPEAIKAFKRRYRDWFSPTPNTLRAMHELLGTDVHREFRRGDLQFAGLKDFEEPEQEEPIYPQPRYLRVIDDFLDTLYY